MKCIITFNIKIAMSNIKSALYTALLMVPTLFFAQHTDIINSNRPGESMSAYAIGKKVIQAEVGTYAVKQHHALLDYDKIGVGLDATLRWGVLTERLEVIADIQYQYEKYNARFIEKTNSALRQTVLGENICYLILIKIAQTESICTAGKPITVSIGSNLYQQ